VLLVGKRATGVNPATEPRAESMPDAQTAVEMNGALRTIRSFKAASGTGRQPVPSADDLELRFRLYGHAPPHRHMQDGYIVGVEIKIRSTSDLCAVDISQRNVQSLGVFRSGIDFMKAVEAGAGFTRPVSVI